VEFNNFLIEYYKQLSQTWTDAQNEVTAKASKLPKDEEGTEAYKRVWIDNFENYFTGLFDSKKFSENYNKLISKELDLMKRWNVVMDIMLKSANMPTKQEIDEIYKELHSLKQKISKLESSTKKSDKNDAE
jgi:L-rhamnose mutarotase